MSLLDLLSLDDARVDIVSGALMDWCRQTGSSIDDENGRHAMTVAVTLAKCGNYSQMELVDAIVEAMQDPKLVT